MDYYFIIPHPYQQRVLLVSTSSGWSLPQLVMPRDHDELQRARLINAALLNRYDMQLTVLRWGAPRTDSPTLRESQRVYVMENHSLHDRHPPETRWIDETSIATLPLALPAHRAELLAWFAAPRTAAPIDRLPWHVPGWFAEASAWIHIQLDQLGIIPTSSIEQLYTKYGACMLQVSTDAGRIYFKAVPPSFAREPRVMQILASYYPAYLPRVLAIEDERHWLLTQDCGGTPLNFSADLKQWEFAVATWAALQRDCTQHVSALLAAGCPDLRLEHLAKAYERLLDDRDILAVGQPGGLTSDEHAALRLLVPRVVRTCNELAAYEFLQTLDHGDLNPFNIKVNHGGVCFFDLTDSIIAHPFFSLVRLLDFVPRALRVGNPLRTDDRLSSGLRSAYLEAWTSNTTRKQLERALQLAGPLAGIARALNYARLPVTQNQIQWERSHVVPSYLKALLTQAEFLSIL